MAVVTQKISNYLGGISRQSDDKKLPGQVKELINGFPDITHGLTKRPGFKFIKTLKDSGGTEYTGTSLDNAKWFYINRDTDDEIYIGCVIPKSGSTLGKIHVWNAVTGAECTVNYTGYNEWTASPNWPPYSHGIDDLVRVGTNVYKNNTGEFSVSGKTAPTGTDKDNDVYDAPIVASSTAYNTYDYVRTVPTTTVPSKMYRCYQNGTSGTVANTHQWGSTVTTGTAKFQEVGVATRWRYVFDVFEYLDGTDRDNYDIVTVQDTSLITNNSKVVNSKDPDLTPWLRTRQVLLVDTASVEENSWKYLSYTIKIYTQDGGVVTRTTDNSDFTLSSIGNGREKFLENLASIIATECNEEATGLDGTVTGQVVNDTIQLDCEAIIQAADTSVTPNIAEIKVRRYFAVEVTHEELRSTVYGTDATTRPTLREGFDPETQLISIFQENAANVASLPAETFHDAIWLVTNTASLDEDNYWVKFVADNGESGAGYWKETADPNVSIGLEDHTLPHQLINTAANTFDFKQITFTDRLVGDEITNPLPSFVDKKISKTFYYQNRLGFLAADNLVLSQANEVYNFFHITARAHSDADPIDLSVQSTRPTNLRNVIQTSEGLVVFSESQQFILLIENDGILSPKTTSIKSISNYEADININPIEFGSFIHFISKTNTQSRVYSLIGQGESKSPKIVDESYHLGTWIPKTIDTFISDIQSQLLVLSSQSSKDLYVYRTYVEGDKVVMNSWFNWKLPGTVQHINIDHDDFYSVTKQGSKYTLLKANLAQVPDDAVIVNVNGDKINPCMDLYAVANNGKTGDDEKTVVYDSDNDLSKCYIPFSDDTTLDPIIVIAGDTSTGTFSDSGFTVNPSRGSDSDGTYFSVPNRNLVSVKTNVYVGYKFDFDVKLPRTYFYLDQEGASTDYTATLTLARMKFSVGLSGMMGFKLKNKGRFNGSISFTGDGSETDFTWHLEDIDYVDRDQVKVKVNGVSNTAFTFLTDTSIRFTDAPAADATILVYLDEWYSINPTVKADEYLADDIPLSEHSIFTIPIHQRTENTEMRLFNDSPFPVSLNSMVWEGNYSPKYYRRT